ncbi:MAG TPA: hypothetical protein DCZ92_14435 [Elusimicrobia bacterium]|nr:MAG: hypothetical protein A2016_09030 [Elusimicrobia bacterium GWF2_62_30]HBA61981.1 hypothetical protein [Elusimicrobiota bacterium]
MKVVSCFTDTAEMAPLVAAGAGELYCAVPAFPSYGLAARLGTRRLLPAVKRAHELGVKLSLAVNSLYLDFDAPGWRRFGEELLKLDRAGLDSFIVSSPAFFALARKAGPFKAAIHLSSVQPCFNPAAAAFFMRLGASRVIFPVQLTGPETALMVRACRRAGAETELFDYRFFGCGYVNGRCKLHRPVFHTFNDMSQAGELCRIGGCGGEVSVKTLDADPAGKRELSAITARVAVRVNSGGPLRLSGAGAFFDAFAAGAGFLKYGTRSDPSPLKVRKVAAMRQMILLAEELKGELGPEKARAAFVSRMRAWDPARLSL